MFSQGFKSRSSLFYKVNACFASGWYLEMLCALVESPSDVLAQAWPDLPVLAWLEGVLAQGGGNPGKKLVEPKEIQSKY